MTMQAYLDTVKAKTGNTPADFERLATARGLTTYKDVLAWLKSDFSLGHGHANLIAQMVVNKDKLSASPDDRFALLFKGAKAKWRGPVDAFAERVRGLGGDVKLSANQSYINLQRGQKRFGLIQISTAEAVDVGIKEKDLRPTARLQAAGSWNAMVTHRVRVTDATQLDDDLLAWLTQAYHAA